MNTKKLVAFALGGMLLVGGLTGYSAAAASRDETSRSQAAPRDETSQSQAAPRDETSQSQAASWQKPGASAQLAAVSADGDSLSDDVPCEELFQPYEPFGLVYNSSKNELEFNGKTVRWFEDYYTVEDGAQAGNDFFNENGVVDV